MGNAYLAGVALFSVVMGPVAQAADMAVKAPPSAPAPSSYDWSGFYVGANLGGAWQMSKGADWRR